jgi:hypothetical protein
MRPPSEPSAGLVNWGIMRLITPVTTSSHGVGIIAFHPRLAWGEPAVTSAIEQIASDRTWLKSANRVYRLTDEADALQREFRETIVFLIFRNTGGIAKRVEWLDRNGTPYIAWDQAQQRTIIGQEMERRAALYQALQETLKKREQ